jgi:hypothetical protein
MLMKQILWRSCALLLLGPLVLPAAAHPAIAAMEPHASYAGATILGVHRSGVGGAAAVVSQMDHVTVYVSMSGLTPGSRHAERILIGLRGGTWPVKYPLSPLVADSLGRAFAVSVVTAGKIQAMGWSIQVQGTDAAPAPIACGNLWGPDLSFPLQPVGATRAHGAAIILGNMDTRGGMAMRDTGAVVVTLAQGLPANSMHAEQLQKGTCGARGAVAFPLAPLAADAKGDAVAATFLPAMARVMAGGLALDVLAADASAMACGNDTGGKMQGSM